MQVFNELTEVPRNKNTVITLGTFDGIHLGHQKILKNVVDKAAAVNGRSMVITFYPHPRNVVSNAPVKLLNTQDEKAKNMAELGIENLFVINFTKEFSQKQPDKFFKEYVIDHIGIREIVIGHDHHFGKGRGGNVETLIEMGKEFDFVVTQAEAVKINGVTVSSTKVREAVTVGNVKLAKNYLGKYYSFSGIVVEGDKRGRELGFPTANIDVDHADKQLPALGIYLVEFIVDDQKHFGLLSIGKRPTFYNEGKIIPEVFIYDFDRDIYGKYVTVNLVDRIREEKKYSSAEALIEQMNRDKARGMEIIKNL